MMSMPSALISSSFIFNCGRAKGITSEAKHSARKIGSAAANALSRKVFLEWARASASARLGDTADTAENSNTPPPESTAAAVVVPG